MKIKIPQKASVKPGIKYDPILYGKDMEEGIVAVEPIPDEPMVRVYKREKGRLTTRLDKSKVFFYTTSDEPALDKIWDDDTEIWELEGDLHYNILVETNSIRTAWWFRKEAQKGNFYMIRERGQYLLSTGKTLFKGMEFDDVVRMYPDIETYTTPGFKFPNPQRPGDKITIIAIKTNQKKNSQICLVLNDDEWADPLKIARIEKESPDTQFIFLDSEVDLLQAFFILVDKIDPDVIANHSIFNFDLTYIYERCKLHDIYMEMGRGENKRPNVYDTSVYISEKTTDIKCFEFWGRHVIDTMILARQDDAVKRKYENYQLKYLVDQLGEQHEDRIIIPGGRIASAWDGSDPDYDRFDLLKYAVDDALDAQKLDHAFGRAVYKSTQFTPYPYQDVFRLASGGKAETLFVRYYYEHDHSLPQADKRRKFPGGYAGVGKYGYIGEESVLLDVSSLYPSIAIEKNIQPKKDVLEFYQLIIKLFRDFRYEIKYGINKTNDKQVVLELKSTDGSIKIYLNTIVFGYLTSPFSLFNDYDEGTRITEEGQKILKQMIAFAEKEGGIIEKFDTDGSLIIPPKKYQGSIERNKKYAQYVSDNMPKGIDIELDGRYQSSLVVDGKSYALKDHNGKYTIKGDTLKSRSKETFILKHLDMIVKGVLDGDLDVLEASYFEWQEKIKNKQLTKEDVVQYSEIKEPLETYKTKVELGSGNGGRNPNAAYEIALQLVENGVDIRVGDRIEYYVAESPTTLVIDGRSGKPKQKKKYKKVYQLAKNIDEFDPDTINVKHYLKRLADSSEPIYMLFYSYDILREHFGMKMYKKRRDKLAEIEENIYNEILK